MAATDNSLLPSDTGWYTPLDTGPSVSIGRSATPNPTLPVKDPKTPVSDVAANTPADTPTKNYDMKVVKDGNPDARGIEGGDIVRTPKVAPTVPEATPKVAEAAPPTTPKPDKGPDEAPFIQAASTYANALPETLRPVLQNIGPAYQKREAALKASSPGAADNANATVAQHTKAALSDSAEYLKAQQDAMALAAKPKKGVNPLDAVREAWNNNALLYGHPSDMAAAGDPTAMGKLVKARQESQGVMQSSFDADQAQFAKSQAVQKLAVGAFPDFKQRTPEDQAVIMQAAQEHAQDKNSKVAVAALEALGRVEPSKQVAARKALDTPETKAALTAHFQRTQNTNYSDAAHQTTMLIQGHDTRAINWNGSPGPAFPSRASAPPAAPNTYGMNDKDVEFAKMQYKARLDQWEKSQDVQRSDWGKAQDVQRSDWEKSQESQRTGALQQQARDDQFKHEPPHPAMFTKEWEQQQPGYAASQRQPSGAEGAPRTAEERRVSALQEDMQRKFNVKLSPEEAAEKLQTMRQQIKLNGSQGILKAKTDLGKQHEAIQIAARLAMGALDPKSPNYVPLATGLGYLLGGPIAYGKAILGMDPGLTPAVRAYLDLLKGYLAETTGVGSRLKAQFEAISNLVSAGRPPAIIKKQLEEVLRAEVREYEMSKNLIEQETGQPLDPKTFSDFSPGGR